MSKSSEVAAPRNARAAVDPAPWRVPLLRGVVAGAVALAITFSGGHSAQFGFLVFATFAIGSGAVLAFSVESRSGARPQGVLLLCSGAGALLLMTAGISVLIVVVSASAAVTGFVELFRGLRALPAGGERDSVFAGSLTCALAVAVLLIPPDYAQRYPGIDGAEVVLGASVMVVGFLGAYCAVLGVYLTIGALSLKWTDAAATTVAGP